MRRELTAAVVERVDADADCVADLVDDLSDNDVREYHQLATTERLTGQLIDIEDPGLLVRAATDC